MKPGKGVICGEDSKQTNTMTITTQVYQYTTVVAQVTDMQPPSVAPPGLIHTQHAREESWPEGNGKDVKPLSDVTSAHGKDMCDAPHHVS